MRFLLTIMMAGSSVCHAQCFNAFGKKVNCPDFNDSLVLYNNAVKVNNYFEKNRLYEKTRTRLLKSDADKKDIYVTLQKARNLFLVIRRDSSLNDVNDPDYIRPKAGYEDITYNQYYQEVDEYRFYQRELENQIINAESPMPMYDNRISPVVVNEYKCIDTTSIFFGDIVNIPLYIPVMVKPVALLTESEMKLRKELLRPGKRKMINESDALVSTDNNVVKYAKLDVPVAKRGLPVFMYNNYGSGSIIGFIDNREFTRLKPDEYEEFVVQDYARNLLENEGDLVKYIKIRYGGFCNVFK